MDAPVYRLPFLRFPLPLRWPDWRSSGARPAQETRWAEAGNLVMSGPVSDTQRTMTPAARDSALGVFPKNLRKHITGPYQPNFSNLYLLNTQ